MKKNYVDTETFAPVMVLRNVNIFGKKEKIGEEYLTDQGKMKSPDSPTVKRPNKLSRKRGKSTILAIRN